MSCAAGLLLPRLLGYRFGVRITQAEIPQLADKLEAYSEAEVARMQERTACAAQHLHWSTNLGGIMGETGEAAGGPGGAGGAITGRGGGESVKLLVAARDLVRVVRRRVGRFKDMGMRAVSYRMRVSASGMLRMLHRSLGAR